MGSVLIVLVAALNILDWITSIIGYSRGAVEVNPITLMLTARLGDYAGITVEKIVIVAGLSAAYRYSKPRWRAARPVLAVFALGVLMFALIGYAVVVGFNLYFLGL